MPFLTSTDGAPLNPPRSTAQRGELEYQAEVAPGVTVTWDPFTRPHKKDTGSPWLRLAAVMMFDRCLYLPLDQTLLDAEHAAAHLAAADTLRATDPLRDLLVGRALVAGRRASPDVVAYLQRLADDGSRPPPALAVALGALARSYAALSSEVRGRDVALDAVAKAWRRLSSIERAAARAGRVVVPPSSGEAQAGVDRIDPRSVPARVLRLGPTTDTAEISIAPAEQGTLRVRVAAFADEPAPGEWADIGVRLIDRRSGQVRGYGLLGQPHRSPRSPGRHFEGVVVLPDALSAPEVRIDLYDISAAAPPLSVDDTELRRVRRATLFLSDWRALVADVRLWGAKAAPAARLGAIVRQLASDDVADAPLWSGGPSRTQLSHLAALGDRALIAVLRGKEPVPNDDGGVVTAVSGPGDLLVAELAAAHHRSVGPSAAPKVPQWDSHHHERLP